MTDAAVKRALTVLSAVLLVFHMLLFWVMAVAMADSIVWWAGLLESLGPIVTLAALIICLRPPRHIRSAVLNGVILLVYIGIWGFVLISLMFEP